VALRDAGLRRDRAAEAAVDPGLWVVAREATRRAETLLEGGGDEATRHRVRALAHEVEAGLSRAKAVRDLLDRAVDIRSAQEDNLSGRGTDSGYADAFRKFGLDVDASTVEQWVGKLRNLPRPVVVELAAAIDDWTSVCLHLRQFDRSRRLVALARAIDPDDWRDTFRAAMVRDRGLRDQREALKQMASDARLDGLSAQSLTLLGRALMAAGDPDAAISLLREARQRHPDDVWINYYLGFTYFKMDPPQLQEAIRFLTAAQAARPETTHVLGMPWNWTGGATRRSASSAT
jgi:tetratricopeptide (TPR) repeat protein